MKHILAPILVVIFIFSQNQMYQHQEIKDLNMVYKKYLYRHFIAYEKLSNSPKDKQIIEKAFSKFQSLSPTKMTLNEQKAFWINLYNINVIHMVIKKYPVKSINDIENVFKLKTVIVEGESLSLDEIEQKRLRQFKDPRYHFAIVCAALSCPNIIPELYEGNRINFQLDQVTHDFITNDQKNDLKSGVIKLSMIFEWYKDEFAQFGGIRNFINQYLNYSEIIDENRTIKFIEFDWRLNGEITARNLKN